MDSFGDHALTCPCNGDRTVRHNALRNIVHAEATLGGMSPEREKPGLLPARPADDGVARSGIGVAEDETTRQPRARRPADVFLPRGVAGSPMALDFACTSGMRADRVRTARDSPTSVVAEYEHFKRGYKTPGDTESTERQCQIQGFQFVPMVVEAHGGGWGKGALQVLDAVAKSVEAVLPHEGEAASLRIPQRLSISLQRENARATIQMLAALEHDSGELSSGEAPQLEPSLW